MFSGNSYINSLDAKEFNFQDFPEEKPLSEYDDVYEKVKDACSRNSAVLSAYAFGEIHHPGISDIDLIFVLKEGHAIPSFLKSLKWYYRFKSIFVHPFFIVNQEIMENISYIYPHSRYALLYGKDIRIKKLSGHDLKEVSGHLINDIILRHFPSDYLLPLLTKIIDIRICLLRLNSLHHSFRIFQEISGVKKKDWAEIEEDIHNLRRQWFKMPRESAKNELLRLMISAVYVSLDFTDEYSRFLAKHVPKEDYGEGLFRGVQNRISFSGKWSAESSLEETIAHYKKYRSFYSVLPGILALQLHVYSSYKGALSRYISRKLRLSRGTASSSETLARRAEILNLQSEYALKMRHSHYPCFFPLGFKNTKGAKNKIIYAYILMKDNSAFKRIFIPVANGLFRGRKLLP